jgi:phosphatidylglycerophosphate synthase
MGKVYEFCYRYGFTPNHLTIFGLLIVFLGIYLFGIGYEYLGFFTISFGLYLDRHDGDFARHVNGVTKLGKILDRLADKIKVIALVIFGMVFGCFQVTWEFFLLGFFITLFTYFTLLVESWSILLIAYQKFFEPNTRGKGAVWVGKVKFTLQAIFVATLFLPSYAHEYLLYIKPIILLASIMVSTPLAVFSFYYHARHLKVFTFCSLSMPVMAIMSYLFIIGVIQ